MDPGSALELLQNVPNGVLSGLGGILVKEVWNRLKGGDRAAEAAVRALPNNATDEDVVRAVMASFSIRAGDGGTGFVAGPGSNVVATGGPGGPGLVAHGGSGGSINLQAGHGGPATCPHCGGKLP